MKLEDKIVEQQKLVNTIKEMQKNEKQFRQEILEELFGQNNSGTLKTMVGDFVVTGTYGTTTKFSQSEITQAIEDDVLSSECYDAIETEYKLNKKVFNEMPDHITDELNEYLIVKPSLPTIKVALAKVDEDE